MDVVNRSKPSQKQHPPRNCQKKLAEIYVISTRLLFLHFLWLYSHFFGKQDAPNINKPINSATRKSKKNRKRDLKNPKIQILVSLTSPFPSGSKFIHLLQFEKTSFSPPPPPSIFLYSSPPPRFVVPFAADHLRKSPGIPLVEVLKISLYFNNKDTPEIHQYLKTHWGWNSSN